MFVLCFLHCALALCFSTLCLHCVVALCFRSVERWVGELFSSVMCIVHWYCFCIVFLHFVLTLCFCIILILCICAVYLHCVLTLCMCIVCVALCACIVF